MESTMLKVIDLDNQGKENDGFVFVLTIGSEKLGITDQEVIELVKQKYTTAKSSKRPTGKKGPSTDASQTDSSGLMANMSEGESRSDSAAESHPNESASH
jgi:K+-transporting ATPase c subunit